MGKNLVYPSANPSINNAIPSILVNANAGTTGTATLDVGSTDRAGGITLTPGGTGKTSGPQLTVTFGASYSAAPFVVFAPSNEGAVGFYPYVDNITTDGFDISLGSTPDNEVQKFTYVVVESG